MHPSIHLVLEEFSLRMKLTHRGRQSRDNNQDCAGVLIKQRQNLTLSLDFSVRHAIYLFPVQFALGFLFLATKHMRIDCFLQRLLSLHRPLSYAVLIQSFLGKNNFKKEIKLLPRGSQKTSSKSIHRRILSNSFVSTWCSRSQAVSHVYWPI